MSARASEESLLNAGLNLHNAARCAPEVSNGGAGARPFCARDACLISG